MFYIFRVEQELMAKVISKMSTNRTIEPPHISHFVEEVEESVCSDHENSMFCKLVLSSFQCFGVITTL